MILSSLIIVTIIEVAYLIGLSCYYIDDASASGNTGGFHPSLAFLARPSFRELVQLNRHLYGDLGPMQRYNDSSFLPLPDTSIPAIDQYYSRIYEDRVIYQNQQQHQPVPLIIAGSLRSGMQGFVDVLHELGVETIIDNLTGHSTMVLQQLYETSKSTVAATSTSSNVTSKITVGYKIPILSSPFLPQIAVPKGNFKLIHVLRDGRDVAMSQIDNSHEYKSNVDSCYNATFPNATERIHQLWKQDFGPDAIQHIKAMELWNEWNVQLHQQYQDDTGDVLTMRIEDLLILDRYNSILKLAHFVGSSITREQICALSAPQKKVQPIKPSFQEKAKQLQQINLYNHHLHRLVDDKTQTRRRRLSSTLPQHHGDEGDDDGAPIQGDAAALLSNQGMAPLSASNKQRLYSQNEQREIHIEERYGRWAGSLHRDPELWHAIHRKGSTGLALFGYEPEARFMDVELVETYKCEIAGK